MDGTVLTAGAAAAATGAAPTTGSAAADLSADERAVVRAALLAQLTFHQGACFDVGLERLVRGGSRLAHR